MVYLLNKRTGKPELFDNIEDAQNLLLNSKDYTAIANEEYTLSNVYGQKEKITGSQVWSKIKNEGYNLKDSLTEKIQKTVRKEGGSGLKHFAKTALSEAFTLGFWHSKEDAENDKKLEILDPRLAKTIRDEKEKIYGNTQTAGEIAGLISPFVLGKVVKGANLLSKGFKEAAGFIPTSAGINLIEKIGNIGARSAIEGAKRVGIKNKKVLEGMAKAGRAIGYTAGDSILFTASEGAKGAGKSYGENRSINQAFVDAGDAIKKNGIDIFTTSAITNGAFLGGGVALRSLKKAAGGPADAIRNITGKTLQSGANFLRNTFFENPINRKVIDSLRKSFISSSKEFAEGMSDEALTNLANSIPEKVKEKIFGQTKITAGLVRKKAREVFEFADKNLIFSSYTDTLKKLNNGKFPTTKKSALDVLKNSQATYGQVLEETKDEFLSAQINVAVKAKEFQGLWKKSSNDMLKKVYKTLPLETRKIFNKLARKSNIVSYETILKDFDKTLKSFSNKGKALDLSTVNDFFEDFFRNGIKRLAEADVGLATKDGVRKNLAQIAEMSDKELYPILLNKKTSDEKINKYLIWSFKERLKQSSPEVQTVMDIYRARNLSNRKRLTIGQIKEFEDISIRHSPYQSKILNPELDKIKDAVKEGSFSVLDSNFFTKAPEVIKDVGLVLRDIGEFTQSTTGKSALTRIKKILDTAKEKKVLNIFELNDLKRSLGELSNFQQKLKSKATINIYRRTYGKITELENKLIERLIKDNKSQALTNTLKKLKETKKNYSTVDTIMDALNKTEDLGSNIFSQRDILLTMGGLYYGGPLTAAAMFGTTKLLTSKFGFLKTSDVLETIAKRMRKDTKKIKRLVSPEYFSRQLTSKKTKPLDLIRISGLGYMFFNDEHLKLTDIFEKMHDIKQKIKSFTAGNKVNYDIISDNLGQTEAIKQQERYTDMVHIVQQDIPKPSVIDKDGRFVISKRDEDAFIRKVSKYLSPENFFESFKNGYIDKETLRKFQIIYPEIFQKIIINFHDAVNNKRIRLTQRQQNLYRELFGRNSLNIITMLDKMKEEEEMIDQQRYNKGVRFNSVTQPTQSQRVRNL